jgi:hypothetical protein
LSINFENSKERINKIKPKKIVHPLQKKKGEKLEGEKICPSIPKKGK